MTVVFRADASDRIGTGHVMRCLTLAGELQARGARPHFVCREHQGHLIGALRERAVAVSALPAAAAPAGSSEAYASWLGVEPNEDAEQTIRSLDGEVPDWLVVDHYALGIEWERRIRPHVGRLFVIDDLADRPHDCDALLDQNYSSGGAPRHRGLVPDACELLEGPHYALLAPEYPSCRRSQRPREPVVRRVLVYFGGADPSNMTARALAALSAPSFSELAVDLVIGTNHRHRDAVAAQAAARPGTRVHGTRPHLADLMAGADLAIGGGGGTAWERMCLGLPSLVVSLAENQRPTCEALAAAGLIEYLGDADAVGATQIGQALERLLEDRGRREQLSTGGRLMVDGDGASRVAAVMLGGSAEESIRTRNALHQADVCPTGFDTFAFAWIDRCRADEVLLLRNMPHVIAQMRSRRPISDADHRRFLAEYDHLYRYDFVLIDTSCGRYVGTFYLTDIGSTPEIGKYIGASDYLGKGIARKATQSLLDFCRSRTGLRRLMATTRSDNQRNIQLNTSLGFKSSGSRGDYLVMTLAL